MTSANIERGDSNTSDVDCSVNQIYVNKKLLMGLNKNPLTIKEYIDNLTIVLKVLGYTSLRPHQQEAISHLFTGKDLLFVVPTSAGKSAVYIAAGACMHLKTIIFSPLVSLIQDQADTLKEKGFKVGVVNSAVTQREKSLSLALWESGDLDFLFVAPERLQNQDFIDAMNRCPPEFVVVDEIHCAYEHGDNFRASYKLIAPFVKSTNPKLFLGLTATMSQEVEESVRNIFDLHDVTKLCRSYKRDNLHYKIYTPEFDASDYEIDNYLISEINRKNENGELVPTIVYCSTAIMAQNLYSVFGKHIKGGAMVYTGDMPVSEKESNQQNFLNNKIRVAFATNAFGMGVDKPNIGKVIFRTIPSSVEELTQGFGRGGRNGCDCDCILVEDIKSINTQKFFIDIGYPPRHIIEAFYSMLKTLADDCDLIYASLSEICKNAGIHNSYSGALSQILQGYKVIERTNIVPEAKIRVLDSPNSGSKLDSKFETYISKIEYIGIEDEGFIRFDLGFLAKELDISVATVKKVLKSFDQLGYIKYIPPARVSPLKLIGTLKNVDFKYLEHKKLEKEDKLNDLLAYIKIPDNKKADFLEEYFTAHN